MPGRFSIEAVLKAVDRVSAPVTKMGNRMGKVLRRTRAGVDRLNRSVRKVGKTFGTALGVVGAAGALLALRAGISAVISKGAEFEQTLVGAGARFSTPIQKGTAAFKELEDVARKTGATTEFTANQAAGGLNFLAKAGFSAAQSMELLPGLVDFATASELDLARASDIASDAIGAFGLMTDDTAQLSKNFALVQDQMSKAANSANVNVEQLFESIRKAAPAVTAVGAPMETFIALAGRLAQSGLKASDAGTAMKNIFLALAKSDVQKGLKDLGVSVKDIDTGEIRDFADIMEDLNAATASKSKIERAGIVNELFGLRGVTGVATILTEGTDRLRDFRNELINSEGATGRLATTMRDTLTGEMKTLNSAVESLTLTIFDSEKGGISDIVTGLTTMTRALDGFLQRNPIVTKMVVGFGALAVGALVVAGVVAAIAAGIGFIASSAAALVITGGILGAAFLKWLNPIDKIVAASEFLFDQFAKFFGLVASIPKIAALIDFLGFGSGEDEEPGSDQKPGPVSSPNERTAGAVSETINRSTGTLTIKDQTGTAELETSGDAPGVGITLEQTGSLD